MTEPQRLELGFMGSPEGASRGSWCYRMAWRLRRTIVYASLRTGIPLPDFMQRKFAKGITHRWAVYDAVRESSGATLIVDASKGYLPGIATYLARPANTRFILLTRDGRAVFNSNIKRGFDRKYALRVWHNYYRRGLPLIARHADPRHVLRVRYEDLASNPEREARRICEFCELDYEANMLDTASKTQHITSGNNMRFRSNKEISPDMSWRKQLSAADQEFFHRKAGIINHELGYE